MTIDTSILEILNKVCDENDVNEEFKENIKSTMKSIRGSRRGVPTKRPRKTGI